MSTKSQQAKKPTPPAMTPRMAAFQAAKMNMFAQARFLKGVGPGGQQPSSSRRIGTVRRGTR